MAMHNTSTRSYEASRLRGYALVLYHPATNTGIGGGYRATTRVTRITAAAATVQQQPS
jgi:hypothetical protein